MCTSAARAGYCQDGKSYTKDGTLVDLFDTRQIDLAERHRESVQRVEPRFAVDDGAGVLHLDGADAINSALKASALQRSRYKELSPSADRQLRVHRSPRARQHRGWALGEPAHQHAPHPGLLADLLTHNEYTVRTTAAALGLHALHDEGLPDEPRVLRRGSEPGVDRSLRRPGDGGLQDGRRPVAGRARLAGRRRHERPKDPAQVPFRAAGRRPSRRGNQRVRLVGDGVRLGVQSGVAGRDRRGGNLGAPRETVEAPLAVVQADKAIVRRSRARSALPATVPAAPTPAMDSLTHCPRTRRQCLRVRDRSGDGRREAGARYPDPQRHRPCPRCAHSEHEVGAALAEESAIAPARSVGRTRRVARRRGRTPAQLANACTPTNSSAPLNSRVYAAVTTGWVEAPSDGTYTFDSSIQPSRLFINGTPVLDWFEAPGTKQGSIDLGPVRSITCAGIACSRRHRRGAAQA